MIAHGHRSPGLFGPPVLGRLRPRWRHAGRHPANPAVAPLAAGSKKLTAASAQPLYTLTFHQAPASVTETAGQGGHNANLLLIVKMWIPIGLGVIGFILVGLAFTGRWRRQPPAAKPTQPGPQKIGV